MTTLNYIVIDLEWNQGNQKDDNNQKKLPFEIIEIGAVKLNESLEFTDEFSSLIKPQVYEKMHEITGELIQIQMEELEQEEDFPVVINEFLKWCGEDYIFATWGPLDLLELQRNIKFYGLSPLAENPIAFLDVQKLFSIAFEDGKKRRSLEYAIDFVNIDKMIPFHRAYYDAYYTSKILYLLNDEKYLTRYSFDTFCLPKSRKEEIKIVFDDYSKYISREFETKKDLMSDREVISTKCYLCRCNLKKKMKWFTKNNKHYYNLAYCEKHGYIKYKIRVRKSEDDKIYTVKTSKMITNKQAEEFLEKKK
ncbi:MAG: exonuclease domain-containing protein [Lachnospiraceae bacterium]